MTSAFSWQTSAFALLQFVLLLSHFSRVRLCVTPSLVFSRQEYWSGLPFSSPGDHPDSGIKPASPASPALAGRFFTTETPEKPF